MTKVKNNEFCKKLKFVFSGLMLIQMSAFASDPVTSYIVDGKPTGSWEISIGNALNYYIPLENGEGKTAKGNLSVNQNSRNENEQALLLKWKGKKVKNQWGGNTLNNSFFSIGKHSINIAQVEDLAALAIELKVIRKPTESVTFSMQCDHNNKCGGKLPIKSQLKKAPKEEWTVLTLPLNCFNKKGNMDFSNVTQIASIATQGKLEIELRNIGLVALPSGSKGCK